MWLRRTGFGCLGWPGGYIQVLEPGKLIQEGDMRSLRVKAMPSARGIISDRNDEHLAVSVPVQAVWADPVQIYKNGGIQVPDRWFALADVLGLDRQQLLSRLEKKQEASFYLPPAPSQPGDGILCQQTEIARRWA